MTEGVLGGFRFALWGLGSRAELGVAKIGFALFLWAHFADSFAHFESRKLGAHGGTETEGNHHRATEQPIEIISYSADIRSGDGIARGVVTEGIVHYLQFKNRGTQKVVATTAGISMADLVSGKTERSSFIHNPYAAFSFLTGLAYVNLVRFEDGTLWQADEATVLAEIRKIEKDFDAKLLKEKEGPVR